ncbi:MAG: MOSC domain-containing protein [Armatimonadaceae bacterium]
MTVEINGLFYYPIKSCRGTAVEEAALDVRGFRHDRRWMVVRAETGRFVTQREYPRMAQVCPTVAEGSLLVSAPGMSDLCVPPQPEDALTRRSVSVWQFSGDGLDEGEEAAEWFSAMMGFPCRLVRTPDDFSRRVSRKYSRGEEPVGFADGFPFLLTSEESLADLNSRLEAPVPMARFRPNIVVRGATAWAEETWRTLRATGSGTEFTVAKPCTRCAVTTVDQESGAKMGAEPLATLARYRRDSNGKVCFAVNLVANSSVGVVRVGEVLEVVSLRSKPFAIGGQ